MNNAPPVVFPVGRFVLGPWILLFLGFCGAMGLLFWQTQADTDSILWAWALWCFCALAAVFAWRRERLMTGRLVWSGDTWWWRDLEGREFEIQIQVLADVGTALWVGFRTVSASAGFKTRFAWIDGREMPALWHGFRCAVYSRPIKKHKNPGSQRVGD